MAKPKKVVFLSQRPPGQGARWCARSALVRARKLRSLLERAIRNLEEGDEVAALTAAAVVNRLWEPFGSDVEHAATMNLIACIERAARGRCATPQGDAEAELAKYREEWGVEVNTAAFLAAVSARERGGNTAWWPHAYDAIQSAGLKPQSLEAVKKAWKRWRDSLAPRLLG